MDHFGPEKEEGILEEHVRLLDNLESEGARGNRNTGGFHFATLWGNNSTIEIKSDEFTIGRSPKNDLVIQNKSVSALHAVIVFSSDGDCLVRDLGSRNGTFVNEKRFIDSSSLISSGDVLHFGFDVASYRIELTPTHLRRARAVNVPVVVQKIDEPEEAPKQQQSPMRNIRKAQAMQHNMVMTPSFAASGCAAQGTQRTQSKDATTRSAFPQTPEPQRPDHGPVPEVTSDVLQPKSSNTDLGIQAEAPKDKRTGTDTLRRQMSREMELKGTGHGKMDLNSVLSIECKSAQIWKLLDRERRRNRAMLKAIGGVEFIENEAWRRQVTFGEKDEDAFGTQRERETSSAETERIKDYFQNLVTSLSERLTTQRRRTIAVETENALLRKELKRVKQVSPIVDEPATQSILAVANAKLLPSVVQQRNSYISQQPNDELDELERMKVELERTQRRLDEVEQDRERLSRLCVGGGTVEDIVLLLGAVIEEKLGVSLYDELL